MLSKLIAAAFVLTTASGANAASAFDGTWKFDIKTQQVSQKPNVYVLSGGKYSCSSCVPAYTVAADGAFHPVAGNPYYDEVAVTPVDATTMKWASRKGGKPMADNTRTVSADGKTMTVSFNDMTATNGVPVAGKSSVTRAAAGPAGSHATSGGWLDTPDNDISDAALLVTIRMTGKTMTMTTPTGIMYTAVAGGPVAPVTGDPGWTTVALKAPTPTTLVETDYRDGKVNVINTYTLAADGRSMRVDTDDVLHKTKSSGMLVKQ